MFDPRRKVLRVASKGKDGTTQKWRAGKKGSLEGEIAFRNKAVHVATRLLRQRARVERKKRLQRGRGRGGKVSIVRGQSVQL